MIAGMIPMALALGDGGEQMAPLGRAVIGGLIAATLTTLIVLPAIFAIVQAARPRRRCRSIRTTRAVRISTTQTTRKKAVHEAQPSSVDCNVRHAFDWWRGMLAAGQPRGQHLGRSGRAVAIDVATVVSQPLAMIAPLPGELRPFESVAVFSKVAGFVKSIGVDRGSMVKQGEVIAHLDAPELTAQRAEADAKVQALQAQMAASAAKVASDESTLARLKAAVTPGVVAGNDLDVAARVVEADRAQVAAQQQAVAAAMQSRTAVTQIADYLDVRAPFDGIVTERNVHPGALVNAGGAGGAEPLIRIEMQTTLRLVVPIPEVYASGVTAGRRVEFSVASYPGRTLWQRRSHRAHG